MLHIALYQPEIPPNTGNIMRLCVNGGACLHLIHPLGFSLDDKSMRRAGLDYYPSTLIKHYTDTATFVDDHRQRRIFACSTKANQSYHRICFKDEDLLLFGPESRGLPQELLLAFHAIRIPMRESSRSLNLSNAVAIVLYEAWRQLDFI